MCHRTAQKTLLSFLSHSKKNVAPQEQNADKESKNQRATTISASEIASYSYCPYSWYLTRKYGIVRTESIVKGSEMHRPLILILAAMALEEKGYGRSIYCGHEAQYPTLRSVEYQILGRPDYILQKKYELVPVEVKSSDAPQTPYKSHIMQLVAYCLLTEENYRKPEFGLILYSHSEPFEIDYLRHKSECLEIVQDMQKIISSSMLPNAAPGNKCNSCAQKERCRYFKTLL